jgi:hypothetical protein
MSAASSRYERQMRLPEVGPLGQARIEASALRLDRQLDDLGRAVARRYALGAGIVREGDDRSWQVQSVLSTFRHPTARSVAAGAALVLSTIVEALDS